VTLKVAQLRWFNIALVFMTGVVVGVSLESLLSTGRSAARFGRVTNPPVADERIRNIWGK